jgi:hypothetical protein
VTVVANWLIVKLLAVAADGLNAGDLAELVTLDIHRSEEFRST